MEFISVNFTILFIITVLLYYVLPGKFQKPIVLLSSSIFIANANVLFLVYAAGITLLCYFCGLIIENAPPDSKKRSRIFISSLILHILILFVFKYAFFVESNILNVTQLWDVNWSPTFKNIILPLGISFYIFQAISYLVDIYWEEIEAEKNVLDFSVYMLFFMKFLSGPIERSDKFIPQLKGKVIFDYDKVVLGCALIAAGMFKKLIIADRLAPGLDIIFENPAEYSGIKLIMGLLVYPLYLYADFSGYTDMALGGASILGYNLSSNFNRPFAAKTITDFWRRWHMSLSFWVRDYIYEPIAASRRQWGIYGIIFSLFVSFTILGFWHGSNWNFIIYGAIQGAIISYELLCKKSRDKISRFMGEKMFNIYSILRTYVLFAISLLFFRIESFSQVWAYFENLFDFSNTYIKDFNLNMRDHDFIVFALATFLLFILERVNSKYSLFDWLRSLSKTKRWAIYYLILFFIFLFASTNSKDFIYLQF